MANIGKTVTKLLSPCRLTPLSASPRKSTLVTPENKENKGRGYDIKGDIHSPKFRYSPLPENSRFTSEFSKRKTNHASRKLLQVPNNESLMITSPITKKMTEKGLEGIHCSKILGRGRFGTVIKGMYKDNPVAVKIVSKSQEKLNKDLKEENAMQLIHPYINRVLKTVSSKGSYDIIMMEYIHGTNLLQKINDTSFSIDEERMLRYALELGHALQHCHRNKIVHLDVKPQNVIIDSEDHCKLCDFGSSRILDIENTVKAPWPGTPIYAAPEVLKGHYITCSADMYSYGITLWHLMSREMPYFGENLHSVIYKVVAQSYRPKKLEPKSRNQIKYIKLYEKCWQENDLERLTAEEVLIYILKILNLS